MLVICLPTYIKHTKKFPSAFGVNQATFKLLCQTKYPLKQDVIFGFSMLGQLHGN